MKSEELKQAEDALAKSLDGQIRDIRAFQWFLGCYVVVLVMAIIMLIGAMALG